MFNLVRFFLSEYCRYENIEALFFIIFGFFVPRCFFLGAKDPSVGLKVRGIRDL